MTRLRQSASARRSVEAEYHEGLRDMNAPPPDMAQLPQTRGPDPIGEDVRAVLGFVALVAAVAGLITWAVL